MGHTGIALLIVSVLLLGFLSELLHSGAGWFGLSGGIGLVLLILVVSMFHKRLRSVQL